MGKHFRKILSVLMALTMLLSVLPASVLAEALAPAEEIALAVEAKEEATPEPTEELTPEPTEEPTPEPTEEPTPEPTEEPAEEPTPEPTPEPTEAPEGEGDAPAGKTDPTQAPSGDPTEEPTSEPTQEPTPEATSEPTPEPAPATYLKLSGRQEITVGKSATLSAKNEVGKTVKNTSITWKSSDKTIATVKDGVVSAKAVGFVTITGSTKSGRVGTLDIEVIPRATSVAILLEGEELPNKHTYIANYTETKSLQLGAKAYPAEAGQAVSWKSSNTDVAKVNSEGLVSFRKPGSVTITATAKDGSKKLATLSLKIRRFITDIKISGKGGIACGKTTTLKAGITPSNASLKTVTWSVSNPDAAKIDSKGLFTAKTVTEPTEVIVTAASKDGSGVIGQHSIWVHPAAQKVVIQKDGEDAASSLIVDITTQPETLLTARVLEENAYQGVSWKSSDGAIAKISSEGVLTARKPGKVTITATAQDGSGKKDTLSVTIRRFVTDIKITGKGGIACGKQTTLKAGISPSNASLKSVKWSVSNPDAAKIDSKGLFTAKTVTEPTEVIVTAASKDGSGVIGQHSIWVHPAARKVVIQKDGEDAASSMIVDITTQPETQLTARVLEENAYQGVSWKSSDGAIAKISSEGILTARKPGKVTITATAQDGSGKKDTLSVTIRRFVTNIKITGKGGIACGKTTTLKAGITPSNASLKSVKWSVDQPDAAKIDSKGLFTAKTVTEPTEVIVTAASKDGSGVIGQHSIWVHPAAQKVVIQKDGEDAGKTAVIDFVNNPTLTLTSAVYPENAYQGVSWKSSNSAVAKVENGVIEAKKPGTVTITATAQDGTGKKDVITLYIRRLVTEIKVTGAETVLAPGKTRTLKAAVSPADASLKSVTWSSSDPKVAKVDSKGVVTAATGLNRITPVTIRATAKDGSGVYGEFVVNVGKDSVVYRALLIGNTYSGETKYLPGPENDVQGMKKMLARYPKTDYDVTVRQELTASQIESAVYDTFEYADANDISLFYYSGHGTSAGELCGTGNTYVSVDELRACLDTVPGQKIVILDSCYSGKHINRSAARSAESLSVAKEDPKDFNDAVIAAFSRKLYSRSNLATDGYVVITACSEDQESFSVSYGSDDEYVGAFTYALCLGSGWNMIDNTNCERASDTLVGNENGKIELFEAYGFAAPYVEEFMFIDQQVQVWGNDGDFVMWAYR